MTNTTQRRPVGSPVDFGHLFDIAEKSDKPRDVLTATYILLDAKPPKVCARCGLPFKPGEEPLEHDGAPTAAPSDVDLFGAPFDGEAANAAGLAKAKSAPAKVVAS